MTSIVYFLKSANGLIKIGRTRHLSSRQQTIEREIGSKVEVIATVAGGSRLEAILHREFAASRRYGEWFEQTPQLLKRIDSLIRTQSDYAAPNITFGEAAGGRKAKEFLSILISNVIGSRSADISRLSAIDDVAAKVGATPAYIRKLLAMNDEMAVDADFMIAVVQFYRDFCADEEAIAVVRAAKMRGELSDAERWITQYTKIPSDADLMRLMESSQ